MKQQPADPVSGGGILLHRHNAPLTRRSVVYFCSGAHTLVQTAVKTEEKVNSNLGLLEGVHRFVLHVRELSVDLIDSINPFGEAYAVLARTLNADILRQMQEKIAAKRVSIPEEEALALTRRALDWKKERGRAPQITSADAWERTLAEGVAAYQQHVARKKAKAAGETA